MENATSDSGCQSWHRKGTVDTRSVTKFPCCCRRNCRKHPNLGGCDWLETLEVSVCKKLWPWAVHFEVGYLSAPAPEPKRIKISQNCGCHHETSRNITWAQSWSATFLDGVPPQALERERVEFGSALFHLERTSSVFESLSGFFAESLTKTPKWWVALSTLNGGTQQNDRWKIFDMLTFPSASCPQGISQNHSPCQWLSQTHAPMRQEKSAWCFDGKSPVQNEWNLSKSIHQIQTSSYPGMSVETAMSWATCNIDQFHRLTPLTWTNSNKQ
jgi:hypothetical protein